MRTITALSIDSLIFDNTNFILSEVKGLAAPTVRLPRYNLPGSSGAYVSNALYGERQISLKGYVNAPDGTRTTYLNNRTQLLTALAFKRDVNNAIVPQTLALSLENGLNLTTNVYVDKEPQLGFSEDQVDYEEFLITLVAPDPNLYAVDQFSQLITLAVGGGTAIPTIVPINLLSSSGGQAVINNAGSVNAYPIITLAPPLLNPFITNLRTNQFIKLTLNMPAGTPNVYIDMAAQTIKQGTVDISGTKSTDSTFWYMMPGNNTIGFSATTGTGSAQVQFYPAYVGV